MIGHDQQVATLCPGTMRYSIIDAALTRGDHPGRLFW